MDIMLFGAAGRTGRRIAKRLGAAGHRVTAVVRPGRKDAMAGTPVAAIVEIDLTDTKALRELARGRDAVVTALASGKGNPAASRLAEALLPIDDLRFVSVGGAAVDAPGDAKGAGDRVVGGLMRLVAGAMLADRQREFDLIGGSGLRWTMLRPPRLTDGSGTGRWRLTDDRPASTQIPRDDLAAAAVAVLTDPATEGRAPFVSA
jgi:putative NADH-flavin reductase